MKKFFHLFLLISFFTVNNIFSSDGDLDPTYNPGQTTSPTSIQGTVVTTAVAGEALGYSTVC